MLKEELRPEYEEVLQEKKAKMKAQSKKKVFCPIVFFAYFRYNGSTCDTEMVETVTGR